LSNSNIIRVSDSAYEKYKKEVARRPQIKKAAVLEVLIDELHAKEASDGKK
jgi:hypothetical protein